MQQTNLLFIMFDDLRPELSVYDRKHMHTPNFDRLARRSVVFDYAYAQVSVCNPSRDSLLTGLRPDTVGTYNFQHSHKGHMLLPVHLARSRYNTAGIGKILHFGCNNPRIWTFDRWDDNWYEYQDFERRYMNSSVTPDSTRPVTWFRDYKFMNRTLSTLDKLLSRKEYFMLSMGFKLPHLALHVPEQHFQRYQGDSEAAQSWKLSPRELKYPPSAPAISYRCCNEKTFQYMRNNGSSKYTRSDPIGEMRSGLSEDMHHELMLGYAAAVSFVDELLGLLLDAIDSRGMWGNLTVVLTSDHGMHNGEKGMWEKWTLFDESTRVPLMIAHPLSPFHGQHYPQPVELVDVYPTVIDLLGLPTLPLSHRLYKGYRTIAPQGKSLAAVVLGLPAYKKHFPTRWATPEISEKESLSFKAVDARQHSRENSTGEVMPLLTHDFAVSQVLKCSPPYIPEKGRRSNIKNNAQWIDCDLRRGGASSNNQALMGYALRTMDFKYIAYFRFNRTGWQLDLGTEPHFQELYDHRNEQLADFTHRELSNLASRPTYADHVRTLKTQLLQIINSSMQYRERPWAVHL